MTISAPNNGHDILLGGNVEWERAPIRHVHGSLQSAVTVGDDLHIVGSVLESAFVTAGRILLVEGLMAGRLHVQTHGRFEMEGRFSALVDSNEGQMTLWGIVETPTILIPGVVKIRAGSAVVRDGKTFVLEDDGTLLDDPFFDLDLLTTPGRPFYLMPDGLTFSSSWVGAAR